MRIQNDLFDLGADVATPGEVDGALRIVASQVARLEVEIDEMNASLEPLTSFILPSGSAAVSALHLARAVVRRAERAAVALNEREPLNPHLLAYLNRLSDHLFVAARCSRRDARAATCCGSRGRRGLVRRVAPAAQSAATAVMPAVPITETEDVAMALKRNRAQLHPQAQRLTNRRRPTK